MRSLVSGRRDVIDLARLEQGKLATQPYEWTFVNGLYSERDAKLLADTIRLTTSKRSEATMAKRATNMRREP